VISMPRPDVASEPASTLPGSTALSSATSTPSVPACQDTDSPAALRACR